MTAFGRKRTVRLGNDHVRNRPYIQVGVDRPLSTQLRYSAKRRGVNLGFLKHTEVVKIAVVARGECGCQFSITCKGRSPRGLLRWTEAKKAPPPFMSRSLRCTSKRPPVVSTRASHHLNTRRPGAGLPASGNASFHPIGFSQVVEFNCCQGLHWPQGDARGQQLSDDRRLLLGRPPRHSSAVSRPFNPRARRAQGAIAATSGFAAP